MSSSLPGGILQRDADGQISWTDSAWNALQRAHGVRPIRVPPTMLWAGATGHPFTITSAAGGNANDTSDFTIGTESIKIVTNGGGAQAKIAGTLASPIDFTGNKNLLLFFKTENLSHLLGGYPRVFIGDLALTNTYSWQLSDSVAAPWQKDSDWNVITLPFGAAITGGAPTRSSLAALTIQVFDDSSGNPVTFHFGGVGLSPPPSGFPNGVVSFTHDDGFLSQFSTVAPYLDKYGFGATAYVICETLFNKSSGLFNNYFTTQQALQLQEYHGWEIAAHAYTAANHNASYTGIPLASAVEDMLQAKLWLAQNGFIAPDHISWPLGRYNATLLGAGRQLFTSGRSNAGLPTAFPEETFPPADLSRMRCFSFIPTTTLLAMTNAVDRAFANQEWLIFNIHDVVASGASGLQVNLANFTGLVDYVATKGIPVRTISQVMRS